MRICKNIIWITTNIHTRMNTNHKERVKTNREFRKDVKGRRWIHSNVFGFDIAFHELLTLHDDVTRWKPFPHYCPFVRGIHRSPVDSPDKGQWRGALMLSLIKIMTCLSQDESTASSEIVQDVTKISLPTITCGPVITCEDTTNEGTDSNDSFILDAADNASLLGR